MENNNDKAIRLIDYLTELARLRTKIIRDINEYQNVLWLHEIPRNQKYCFTQAWGPNEEYDQDIWIEIKKYKEPTLGDIPEICEEWVDESSLYNIEEMPELLKSIPIQEEIENPDADSNNPDDKKYITVTKTLELKDHPAVSQAWDVFVLQKWIPWSDLHRKWQAVQRVYARLFAIYQEQLRLGEEYELVLDIGFLIWKTPSGQIVRRHLIASKANLTFEAKLGKFTIMPALDGAQIAVELDMLDIGQQPLNASRIEKDLQLSSSDNPWDRIAIDAALTALANSLSDKGEGEYYPNTIDFPDSKAQPKPIVYYAPALILRKRSVKGLQQILQTMKESIKNGEEIPFLFRDICESLEQAQEDMESKELHLKDFPIYFPKAANEEQRQIVYKLQTTSGILVQGPPGTGKSHTIANLICHLLATGKRVLVTAKTPRALQVLHDKLPPEVQPLCISLLGNSIDEQRSLEESVSGILSKQDNWKDYIADKEIESLTASIDALRKEKSETDYYIRTICEKETFEHTLVTGNYRGTAAKIAIRLQKEATDFNWFQDRIKYEMEMPFSSDNFMKLYSELSLCNQENIPELGMAIPSLEKDLPPIEIFQDLMQKFSYLKERLSSNESLPDSEHCSFIESKDNETIQMVIDSIVNLITTVETIQKMPMPWIKKAIHDVLSDKTTLWKNLLKLLSKYLPGLKERTEKIHAYSLTAPQDVNRKKLLHDAQLLKEHLEKGGSLGNIFFKPKIVRECKYVLDDVKINGLSCKRPEILKNLIEYLEAKQIIEDAWKLFENIEEKKTGPLLMQVSELIELQEALQRIVTLHETFNITKITISKIQGLGEPVWHDFDALRELINSCKRALLKKEFNQIDEKTRYHRNKIELFANQRNSHPISRKILSAMKEGQVELFSRLISEVEELQNKLKRIRCFKDNFEKLSDVAPILAKSLSSEPNNMSWEERIKNIEKAWAWRRASSWMEDFIKKDDLESLERRSRQIEDEINKKIATLSSTLAWQYCFDRLKSNPDHRRHLLGWQQEIKKLGKGTGKHAPKHRRNAQEHLNQCKESVSAWVMPLHKVYDTVKAAPCIFDTIIVDEASQCGPEALPLMYLAKQVVVVGDDNQISPEAVGLDRDQVEDLMKKYLYDFKHSDSFDAESSLFDHAKRRFNNRIVLREHFRCMPEIIRFSNDLCYHATPLIPLRQYPPNRLEPIKNVLVTEGYREGYGSMVINRPEAETIVDTIMQCCSDDQYNGKTMGVIILQGDAQATIIEDMLLKELGAEEIEKRRLICGKPYSFQGDERHVVFLSMVAAPNETIGALAQPADQRRFNVAASRAQDQMWLFHSVTKNDLSSFCLRRRLLDYFENPISTIDKGIGIDLDELRMKAYKTNRLIEKPPHLFDSWFEVDVALQIAARGYRVIPQYKVLENKRIDLMVEGAKTRLAVECDGDYWHSGIEQREKDMERQRMLERCGLKFHRILESSFYANQHGTLESLWEALKYQGIHPIWAEPSAAEIEEKEAADTKDEYDKEDFDVFEKPLFRQKQNKKPENLLFGSANKISPPTNIQEALKLKIVQLQQAIIETLKKRPNNSCVKDALPTFILQEWQIITRGAPRELFNKRVNRVLKKLAEESTVEIYKSKNIRVRLLT